MHKIMFSAGEASGDLHGAGLAAALRRIEPEIEMLGLGGPKMEQAGVKLSKNFQEYSVMGFWEVLKNIHRLFKLRNALVQVMEEEKPDLLVLIDYPDFNWRLAEKAKKLGIPVFSYIPPSAWAWRKGRAKTCTRLADEFVAIFPFEMQVYEAAGANISFVGNPLVDTVKASMSRAEARQYFGISEETHPVLLLPGSRQQEIELVLPVMLESAKLLQAERPDTKFFLPVAPGISRNLLEHMALTAGVELHFTVDKTYDLMGLADFALATSGTVVMEAALMGLPCVVLYRMSLITYLIGRLFVKVENFSLPNILLSERVQPELLQAEVNPQRILSEARRLYAGEPASTEVRKKLAKACELLGPPDAVSRVAKLIWQAAQRSQEKTQQTIGGKK